MKVILCSNDNPLITLDELLTSDKYDKIITDHIKDVNIKEYKKYLLRLIYFDAYVLLKNAISSISQKLNNIDENHILNPLLFLIETSIEANTFVIPTSQHAKNDLYGAFLEFFLNDNDKENSIRNVEKTSEQKLRLLNPLYKIDNY